MFFIKELLFIKEFRNLGNNIEIHSSLNLKFIHQVFSTAAYLFDLKHYVHYTLIINK
jgi:hypothetical protein